jgi:UDP-2,3-diacylglucosamine pyrophosphatase LpxH
MTTKPVLQKIIKGNLHSEQEHKWNQEIWERINLTWWVNKQMRIKKEANITKTTKWHIFQ